MGSTCSKAAATPTNDLPSTKDRPPEKAAYDSTGSAGSVHDLPACQTSGGGVATLQASQQPTVVGLNPAFSTMPIAKSAIDVSPTEPSIATSRRDASQSDTAPPPSAVADTAVPSSSPPEITTQTLSQVPPTSADPPAPASAPSLPTPPSPQLPAPPAVPPSPTSVTPLPDVAALTTATPPTTPPPFYAWWRVASAGSSSWVELAFCALPEGAASGISIEQASPPIAGAAHTRSKSAQFMGGQGRASASLDLQSLLELQRLLSASTAPMEASLSPPRQRRPGWASSALAQRLQRTSTLSLVIDSEDPVTGSRRFVLGASPQQCARAARWLGVVGACVQDAFAAEAFGSAQRGASAGLSQRTLGATAGVLDAVSSLPQTAGGVAKAASAAAASLVSTGAVASGAAAALGIAARVLERVADVTQSIPFVGAAAKALVLLHAAVVAVACQSAAVAEFSRVLQLYADTFLAISAAAPSAVAPLQSVLDSLRADVAATAEGKQAELEAAVRADVAPSRAAALWNAAVGALKDSLRADDKRLATVTARLLARLGELTMALGVQTVSTQATHGSILTEVRAMLSARGGFAVLPPELWIAPPPSSGPDDGGVRGLLRIANAFAEELGAIVRRGTLMSPRDGIAPRRHHVLISTSSSNMNSLRAWFTACDIISASSPGAGDPAVAVLAADPVMRALPGAGTKGDCAVLYLNASASSTGASLYEALVAAASARLGGLPPTWALVVSGASAAGAETLAAYLRKPRVTLGTQDTSTSASLCGCNWVLWLTAEDGAASSDALREALCRRGAAEFEATAPDDIVVAVDPNHRADDRIAIASEFVASDGAETSNIGLVQALAELLSIKPLLESVHSLRGIPIGDSLVDVEAVVEASAQVLAEVASDDSGVEVGTAKSEGASKWARVVLSHIRDLKARVVDVQAMTGSDSSREAASSPRPSATLHDIAAAATALRSSILAGEHGDAAWRPILAAAWLPHLNLSAQRTTIDAAAAQNLGAEVEVCRALIAALREASVSASDVASVGYAPAVDTAEAAALKSVEARASDYEKRAADIAASTAEQPLFEQHSHSPTCEHRVSAHEGKAWAAAYAGDVPRLLLALDNGCSTEEADKAGRTAINIATRRGHLAAVLVLLEAGADVLAVDAEPGRGFAALHRAAVCGSAPITRLLLSHPNISVNCGSARGLTALHVACQGRSAGHAAVVAALLSAAPPANVAARCDGGFTPLHVAAFNCNDGLVGQILASPGADAVATTQDGRTALHVAALSGSAAVVRRLLAHPRTAPNAVDSNGITALAYAWMCGKQAAAEPLLDTLAPTCSHVRVPRGPVWDAADRGDVPRLLSFLASGYSTEEVDTAGKTALNAAAKGGHSAVVRALLRLGADASATCERGFNALHRAAVVGSEPVARFLLSHGRVDPAAASNAFTVVAGSAQGVPPDGSWTALHQAAEGGHVEVVRLLLADPRVDPNAASTRGYTPLMRAALFGRLSTIALLLGDWRVDVNASLLEDGSTALRLAAVGRHAQAVRVLLTDPRQPRCLGSAEVAAITPLSGLCPDLDPAELRSAGFQL